MTAMEVRGSRGADRSKKLLRTLEYASDIKNFRVSADGTLVKRPKSRLLYTFGSAPDGMIRCFIGGSVRTIVAYGSRLMEISDEGTASSIGWIGAGDSLMFCFNGSIYVINKNGMYSYDGSVFASVPGYAPCVLTACTPDGAGTPFEQINLLTAERRQQYCGDGSTKRYRITEEGVEAVTAVTVDGTEMTDGWSYNETENAVDFASAPAKGLNNVEIRYRAAFGNDDRERILGCQFAMQFGGNSDGRIFLWGNEKYPNYRFYSELANGAPSVDYFPVNNYTVIGNSEITSIVQQYDRQLIFTPDSAYYSYCELKTDALGNTVSSYPVFSLNGNKGCIFRTNGCSIDNRPVTLCRDGLNLWESTTVENEKNAVCFSAPLGDRFGSAGSGKYAMADVQFLRELLFSDGSDCFVYNYGSGTWYSYTEMGFDRCTVYGNELIYSVSGAIYIMSGDTLAEGSVPECVWEARNISAGTGGRADITGFFADVSISGEVTVKLTFTPDDGSGANTVTFTYPAGTKRSFRAECRPMLRRVGTFGIRISVSGNGSCDIHGMGLKIRNRERNYRNGISKCSRGAAQGS